MCQNYRQAKYKNFLWKLETLFHFIVSIKMANSVFSPVKRASKCPFSVNEKNIILNVHDALKHQNPLYSVDTVVEMCSQMTGVSKTSIYKLRCERKSGAVKPPIPSSGRKTVPIDEDYKLVIRRTVHSFYFNKEIPTIDKILGALKQDQNMSPTISRKKLWKTLKQMNFSWEKQNRKSLLIEKDEIICWRRHYLRQIKQFRSENRKIYYLDETWLNEGYTVGKIWQDKNISSSRQAFLEGWSTGLKPPSGKGKRLIITHLGSVDGFVEGGLLMFESNHSGDYHEDMNGDVFEEYFEQMLDLIPPNSVIVMDNASYHSRKVDRIPTNSWRKADIIQWLGQNNIPFDESMVKKELLSIVSSNKARFTEYVVDKIAQKRNITILRLPPYHCELNPIELVWAQVKSYVARRNTTFKMKDVKIIFEESLRNVDSEKWRKCIEHVIKEEEKMWKLDHLIDLTVEPLIISLEHDEDSTDFSDDENDIP